MKHVSTSSAQQLLKYVRRGALLLALGAAGPAAWGQSFGPPSYYSTGPGSRPSVVVTTDLNGDGKIDIVTANSGTNGVGVLPGIAGGFGPATLYFTGSIPTSVAVGDMNGDGRTDIVASNQGTNTVGVLLGLNGGGFAPVSAYSTGATGTSLGLAVGDVNGDGNLDIVVAKYTSNTVGVLLGTGGGGFAAPTAYSTGPGSAPTALALGDVNGDGRLDIVTSNYSSATTGVLLGQAGGFAPVNSYSSGAYGLPCGLALGDMNNDGRLDIVIANYGNDTAGVLLGLASGGFMPVVEYWVSNAAPGVGPLIQPTSVALGDVNKDGRLDIVVNSGNTRAVRVLLGQAGGFAPVSAYPASTSSSGPSAVTLNDMNGDNWLDVVVPNGGSDMAAVLLNTGTYTPLATARPTATEDISLYPNPAHDAFTVQLPAGFSPTGAELLNALGQVVRRPAVRGTSFPVETSGLAPGVYTLRLQAGGAALARRVVVE